MPELTIPEKLLPLLEKPKRFKVVIGGRGSGKSQSVADIMMMKAETEQCKIGCFREFMNSLDDSVFSLIKEEIYRLQLDAFTPELRQIKLNGYEPFIFRGLARNVESVKSLHGCKYFWVEEAQTVSEESLRVLTPTLRLNDSEIWLTGNPRSSEDAFSKRFINPFESELARNGYYEDDLHLIVVCNWRDNPWFPDVLNQERIRDKQELSDAEYSHIWEGAHLDEVENSIIKPEWFNAAIDAVEKLGMKKHGAIVSSFDPADTGPDAKAYAVRQGIHFFHIDELVANDGNEACDIALDLAAKHRAELFTWDGDGMGALLRRQVEQGLNKCEARMYKGSEQADNPDAIYDGQSGNGQKTNKELFYNKRAQYYTELSQRFYKTWLAVEKGEYIDPDELISIASDIPLLQKIKAEVCRIPRKTNNIAGKIQIMPKDEMKRRHNIASPNMADCLAMAMEKPKPAIKNKDLNFDSFW
jgi:phage terminase large subunit